MSNIVRMFYIANIYDEINIYDKNTYNIANEIRIDYILNTFTSYHESWKRRLFKKLR